MAITFSSISALVARFGNEIVEEQVNQKAPVVGFLNKHKAAGRVGIVNVKAGGIDSAMWLDDGDALPAQASRDLVQMTYNPKVLFARPNIPRLAAYLASGEGEGINLVREELQSVGSQLARKLADGVINGTQAILSLSGTQATELGAAGTTLTVSGYNRFRVGDAYDRYAGATLEEVIRCTRVQVDDDGTTHTITFTRDIVTATPNTAPAAADNIYPRGAKDDAMVSLKDVTAAANLYGKAITADEWEGNLAASVGTLDVQRMRDLFTVCCTRRGEAPDFVLSNSRNRQRYSDTLLSARRYMSGKMDATGGLEVEFEGKPFKIDESTDSGDIHFVNKSDVELHEFRKFMYDGDGPKGSERHLLVDPTNFVYDAQCWGAYQLRVKRRLGCGSLTGITG